MGSGGIAFGWSRKGGGAFLPEAEYGAILNWGFFKNTNLGLEYLRGGFENDLQTTDTITLQRG